MARERERDNRESATGHHDNDVRRVVLRGGRVLDPSQNLDGVGDVVLSEGKIESFERAAGAPTVMTSVS